ARQHLSIASETGLGRGAKPLPCFFRSRSSLVNRRPENRCGNDGFVRFDSSRLVVFGSLRVPAATPMPTRVRPSYGDGSAGQDASPTQPMDRHADATQEQTERNQPEQCEAGERKRSAAAGARVVVEVLPENARRWLRCRRMRGWLW